MYPIIFNPRNTVRPPLVGRIPMENDPSAEGIKSQMKDSPMEWNSVY